MGGEFWNRLNQDGNLTCFWHKENGYSGNGMTNTIHSVFDTGFDEENGVMKVTSIINTAPRTKKTTLASSSNTTVGNLAAEASRDGNAQRVQHALYKAINAGTVVNETAIANEMEWGNNDTDINDPASLALKNLYNNYEKLSKLQTTSEPEEKGKEVIINNKSYTILGAFKMKFGGRNINSITVGNASWTSTSSKDIYYWVAVSGQSIPTTESSWSKNFNKKTSGNYVLNNKRFYLAVETSKLPDSGEYNITIEQNSFQYYNTRTIVCVGSQQQQTGMYCYDNSPNTVVGEATWTVTRKALKTLEIIKTDKISKAEITGAGFKIYAELADGTTGWVSGSAEGDKTYGTTATEYSAKVEIKNLKNGTYYVYETKAPNGHDLTEQEGYHVAAKGSNLLTGDWVYLGNKDLGTSSSEKVSFSAENLPLDKMKIVKKDKTTGIKLNGGKFKLYAVTDKGTKGWVSGSADGDKTYGNTGTEYDSETEILNLKYGTYYIYETQTPAGYDITKQDGYHVAAEGSSQLSGDWVYLGTQVLSEDTAGNTTFTFTAENKKIVELEGDVWVDVPDTKANPTDNVYTNNTKDYLKSGITVNLYDGSGTIIATETTDSNGHYRFTKKNASTYTGEDKDIYYWDLANSYVEFIYNNKTTYNEDGTVKEYGYITVDPFAGNDAKINSKAQEYKMTEARLDDNNLTGTTGDNPGRAVTYSSSEKMTVSQLLEKNKDVFGKISNNTITADDLRNVQLTCYYNEQTYTVSNINLGLMEQHDAEFDVTENLEYIKVKMKGYTYTYHYGEESSTTSRFVPTVQEQNAVGFTGKIYPTDIAYNMATDTEELQVYVIYSIDVKNTETLYVDNKYVEQRLYIDSLVNAYDKERYTLCNNENNNDSSDFALWSETGDGKASYDVNNTNSAYKDGMAKQETKTSYIQFKIKEQALEKILQGGLTREDIEQAPTIATATGYHEYLRCDNLWIHEDSIRAFNGCRGVSNYPTNNNEGKKYYVHKTISKSDSSANLYLKLSLGEPRALSGTVFEDTRTSKSEAENTNLGNGILEENEKNRASEVTVELLDADKTTVTKLYKEDNGNIIYNEDGTLPEAIVKTGVGGTFTFEGVAPGMYYIRFTYGDSTQKMMPARTTIKSSDYKSTIINTDTNGAGDIIKNAMEATPEEANEAVQKILANNSDEEAKKLVEWYKYLNQSYSTATDDINQRLLIDKYQYKEDRKVYDEAGNKVTKYPTNINSYTPIASISIENDINNSTDKGDHHSPNYDKFNFGIIRETPVGIKLDKKITNIRFTTETGATLVSANPTDKTAAYVTALDHITGGSKYAKLEMDPSLIYGSDLRTTYEIIIENNSAKEYIEDSGTNEFGYYNKYGEKTETAHLKKITVNEVVDQLDEKYNYDTTPNEVVETVIHEDGRQEESTVTIEKQSVEQQTSNSSTLNHQNPDGSSTTTTTNSLSIKGWSGIESQAKTSITYTVTSLLSVQDDDTLYTNAARITSISLDKLLTLRSDFEWGDETKDSTTLTITSSTGADRSNTYWIAGTVALIAIAGGFILLKKKVLKS